MMRPASYHDEEYELLEPDYSMYKVILLDSLTINIKSVFPVVGNQLPG